MVPPHQRRARTGELPGQYFLPVRSPTLVFHSPVNRDDHQRATLMRQADGLHSGICIQRRGDVIKRQESQSQAVHLPVDRFRAGANGCYPDGLQRGTGAGGSVQAAIEVMVVCDGEQVETPLVQQAGAVGRCAQVVGQTGGGQGSRQRTFQVGKRQVCPAQVRGQEGERTGGRIDATPHVDISQEGESDRLASLAANQ